MRPVLLLVFAAAAFGQQPTTPPVPDAPLPPKSAAKNKAASELAGVDPTEGGVMSLAKYEGGSLALKLNKVTTYVNEKEIVIVQNKTRFAIPVASIAEVSYGSAVAGHVGAAAGVAVVATTTKNQSAGNLTEAGIVWTADAKKTGVVLKVDKGDYQNFMGALLQVTGLKAVNTDAK
jgi:hypothetical protein